MTNESGKPKKSKCWCGALFKSPKGMERHQREIHDRHGETPEPKGSTAKARASWTYMRAHALRRDRHRCRVCGAKERLRPETRRESSGPYTHREKVLISSLAVHHVVPRNKGGTDHLDNLITLCDEHHAVTFKKTDRGGIPTPMKGKQERLRLGESR